ncbi:MAG: HAMP domain-containing histidine kinase [Acidaminococcaceae bacterium]|nr:HAMP domain-containing histidine kinase [Acidaminococcaceae bacterium]
MFKSKIAAKLAAYFALAILVFAFVMAFSFGHFFRENFIERQQRALAYRASSVAAIMGDNLERSRVREANERNAGNTGGRAAGRSGSRGEGQAVSGQQNADGKAATDTESKAINPGSLLRSRRLIAYVNIITADDVWVANKDGDIVMRTHIKEGADMKEVPHNIHGRVEHHNGPQGRDIPPVFEGTTTVNSLPQVYRDMFRKGFKGESAVREEFDKRINEMMVLATAPIYDKNGGVEAVLMLRVPVFGLQRSFRDALEVFGGCLVLALILALAAAWFLSLKFTRPLNKMKDTAEKLAAGDYTARCYVQQNDEIGELAATLDSMAGRLEEADRETKQTEKIRKEFIANISHELRTPVTVVRGSLEALRDKVVTEPADVERYYDTMYDETLFLQRLINDLLDLSRLQNVDFPIDKEPLNLCEVIQGAVRSARHLAREKNITIDCDLDTPMYKMTGDFGRLNQMLMIFLDNAVKFSPENSSVEVKLADRRLTVTDHGPGIKGEDMLHVFDRFYKTRGENNKSGSGLGLAIAREIAERHVIALSMQSEYGKGATAVMELPKPEELSAEEKAEMA